MQGITEAGKDSARSTVFRIVISSPLFYCHFSCPSRNTNASGDPLEMFNARTRTIPKKK